MEKVSGGQKIRMGKRKSAYIAEKVAFHMWSRRKKKFVAEGGRISRVSKELN